MDIKTKYNIGDPAWIMFSNRATEQKIHKISVEIFGDNLPYVIKYWLSNTNMVLLESQIVATKEELLKSL